MNGEVVAVEAVDDEFRMQLSCEASAAEQKLAAIKLVYDRASSDYHRALAQKKARRAALDAYLAALQETTE